MSLRAIQYITSDATLDPEFDTFLIDASSATGGTLTFTLKDIENDGENYWIKRIDSSSNTLTIKGNDNTQLIEGNTSINVNPITGLIVIASYTTNKTWYFI